ncbi:MAG: ParB/RepB/Spo0J family partition protein [Bacillota bacterium]
MRILNFPNTLKKENTIYQLPIEKIRQNPYRVGKQTHLGELAELASSIATHGILQPISVRKMSGDSYELISGERRLRGAEMAGLHLIPAILLKANDNDSAIFSFIENLQRQNLNYLEEAYGYQNLILDCGFTQEALAMKLSKSQSYIASKLRLLKLEDSIQNALSEYQYQFGEAHAKALLRLPHEESRKTAMGVMIAGEYNVRQTEELIEEMLEKLTNPPQKTVAELHTPQEKWHITDFRLCTNTLKQSIDVIRKSGMHVDYELIEENNSCQITIKIHRKQVETA